MTWHIGFLVFPQVQQLDLTGPHDVLAMLPGAKVDLIGKTRDPVVSSSGLGLLPTCSYDECASLDVLCIPGGAGVTPLLEDEETLAFIRSRAASARYLGSICTGALLLGAAGLLTGRRATTHWGSHSLLAPLGAQPVHARVVRDGNLFTGGGVTAGIDFALTIAAELAGEAQAQEIQLELEYAPEPPFDAGSPETAPREVVERARAHMATTLAARSDAVKRITARWQQQASAR